MAGDIAGVTNLSSLSLAADLNAAGRITIPSGASLIAASGATVAIASGAHFSMATIAAASSLASLAGTGMQVGLFFAASGLSLVCRSGNTLYYFNSAASGAAP
jgi:uncharacterized protein (DUF2345 family)